MFENTRLVYKKIIHDIDVAIHVVDIIIQVLFLGYYAFYAVKYYNVQQTLFIFYIVLCGLGTIWLIITLLRDHIDKSKKKTLGKIVKYTKWVVRAGVIGVSIYFAVRGNDPLQVILSILSIFFLFGQIIFEIICRLIKGYYRLLMHSIINDAQEFVDKTPSKIKKIGKFFGFDADEKMKNVSSKYQADDVTKYKYSKIRNENDNEEVYNNFQKNRTKR